MTIFGQKVALNGEYARDIIPEDASFAVQLTVSVQSLLDRGMIDAHPVRVMKGGWDAVIQGVDLIRQQAVSGEKLIYPV